MLKMALEQKAGDLLLIGAFAVFIISGFIGIFVGFDNSTNQNEISTVLNNLNASKDYENTETSFQTLISSNTGFKVVENVYIDERGDAEADLIRERSQTSFKNFISQVRKEGLLKGILNNAIFTFIISMILLISGIIGLRMVLGNGRI